MFLLFAHGSDVEFQLNGEKLFVPQGLKKVVMTDASQQPRKSSHSL